MSVFDYLNFDITLSNSIDVISLRFLDRVTFNVYQKLFDNIFIIQHGLGSLHNLYMILDELFKKINKSENNQINIIIINEQIEIRINYKNQFEFNFDFTIEKINTNNNIDGRDIYIKKLENKINELETEINELETEIKLISNCVNKFVIEYEGNFHIVYTYMNKLTIMTDGKPYFEYNKIKNTLVVDENTLASTIANYKTISDNFRKIHMCCLSTNIDTRWCTKVEYHENKNVPMNDNIKQILYTYNNNLNSNVTIIKVAN